jgi:hypothetical protein
MESTNITGDDKNIAFQVYNIFSGTIDYTYYRIKLEIKKNLKTAYLNPLKKVLKDYTERKIAVGWDKGELIYIDISPEK